MNLNNWHSFLNIIGEAGYINKNQISAKNAVIFSYILYLIARYDFNVTAMQLKNIISKWFFMGTVTSFYTDSTESTVEKQLVDCKCKLNKIYQATISVEYTLSRKVSNSSSGL